MDKDKIVIDIETSNLIADVGGYKNIGNLKISLIGVYSYNQNKYLSFDESNFDDLIPLLQDTGLIIGFASNRFDIPVLNGHYKINLFKTPRIDLLDEIELSIGRRISLNRLSQENLGLKKTHESGIEAIRLYKEGKIEELREYCLNDVKLTKDLYELAKKQGYLSVPSNLTDIPTKAELTLEYEEFPTQIF